LNRKYITPEFCYYCILWSLLELISFFQILVIILFLHALLWLIFLLAIIVSINSKNSNNFNTFAMLHVVCARRTRRYPCPFYYISRDHPNAHELINHIWHPSPAPGLRSPGAPGKKLWNRPRVAEVRWVQLAVSPGYSVSVWRTEPVSCSPARTKSENQPMSLSISSTSSMIHLIRIKLYKSYNINNRNDCKSLMMMMIRGFSADFPRMKWMVQKQNGAFNLQQLLTIISIIKIIVIFLLHSSMLYRWMEW
jgi:hypothetical protein